MKKKSQNDQDIAGLMTKVQEQLAALEKKVDALLSRPSPRPQEARPSPQPLSQHVVHAHPDIPSSARPNDPHKARQMFQAVCADCKKNCEIPFKPSGDRPVYCKECFQHRKSTRTLNVSAGNKPQGALPVPAAVHPAVNVPKVPAKIKKKPAAARKPVAKKAPARKKK